jgi:integrase
MGSVVTWQAGSKVDFRTVADQAAEGSQVVPSRKGKRHADVRAREYLTAAEMDKLITAAKKNRRGQRDSLMVLMAYIHGLRSKELVELQWSQVDFSGWLHVNRAKRGIESNHPLKGDEIRALRALRRDNPHTTHVFVSERGTPFSEAGFQKMVVRLGQDAGISFPIHAHMIRHSCGFKLANAGKDTRSLQQYLGHRNINHTVRYTRLAGDRFKGWWD